MALKATCRGNPNHKKFITTAHVMEEWIVDERGNWLETKQCLETTNGPNDHNTWTCAECGSDAAVERVPR